MIEMKTTMPRVEFGRFVLGQGRRRELLSEGLHHGVRNNELVTCFEALRPVQLWVTSTFV